MQFYKCEKKLAEETEAAEGVKYKYIGLAVLWVALALVTGISDPICQSFRLFGHRPGQWFFHREQTDEYGTGTRV